ncbi:MAG: MarR family transcriptional regulator [Candidatus Aenigmatarchaeota archaeon]|nr:MarR family transcriptional regulator [Candidatus Aenigmarchaeota archaeon]
MKKFLIVLLLINIASAQEIQLYKVVLNINQDMSVNEEIKIIFEKPLNQTTFKYYISGNFYNLEINNTVEKLSYKINNQNLREIEFTVPENTQQLFISFKTDDIIKDFEGKKELITTLKFPDSKRTFVYVALPEGYSIYQQTYLPEDADLLTDGERIYLKWRFYTKETPIMVRFYDNQKNNIDIFLSILFIILGVFALILNKKDESFLIGFSSDERRVIEIIKERKVEMQSKIEKELGFSRAKMTRIIKKLESKGLVKKEKKGRTNKISWL